MYNAHGYIKMIRHHFLSAGSSDVKINCILIIHAELVAKVCKLPESS